MSWDRISFTGEDSNACNFTVIDGLNECASAEEMITGVFKEHLSGFSERYHQKLYSHYVFAGPTRTMGNKAKLKGYCKVLANFIKANGLGTVIESEENDNPRWHKGRHCSVFVWTPDQKACEAWWTANKDKMRGHAREIRYEAKAL